MVELEKYVVLEAPGRWRETPDSTSRDVVVTVGERTLILSDHAERPLAHWALAGVQAVDRRGDATVYAMTRGAGETLEISDPDMIAAIAEITGGRPAAVAPRRRPRLVPWLVAAALVAALAVFGPGLVRGQAVRMVPPERAQELGELMLLTLMEAGGGLCAAPEGQRALDRVAARVASPVPRVRVLDLGGAPVAALPGGLVLLDRGLVEAAPATAELAGWIAVGQGRAPLPELMQAIGPRRSLGYVFTGDIAAPALADAARAAPRPPDAAEAAASAALLAAAGIDPAGFVAALLREGLPAPDAGGSPSEPLALPGDATAVAATCAGDGQPAR